MNPTAIYSKSGKGVQEASGKTSALNRADRAVLSAIDGRANLGQVAEKCGKPFDAGFETLITRLDKEGFVREVSSGAAPAAAAPAAASAKPVARPAAPARPTAPAASLGGGSDLDFSDIPPMPKAAPPPPAQKPAAPVAGGPDQSLTLNRARLEAEAKAQQQRERINAETEAKLRAEAEARHRAAQGAAPSTGGADLEAKLRAEAEVKIKAARDAAVRATLEAKAKAEAEMKVRLEAERAKHDEERKKAEEERRKAEEARAKAEAERRAREDAERKAREEAERVKVDAERRAREAAEAARKEADEKARREAQELRKKLDEERARAEAERLKADTERRAREDAERRAREDAERARKEAEERSRREAEAQRKQLEDERRKLDEERKRREEDDRKAAAERRRREDDERAERLRKEDEDRKRRDEEDRARREAVAAPQVNVEATQLVPPPRAPAPAKAEDSLLADLESFGKREEEERKASEAAERKAREDKARLAREEAERQAREQAARKAKEEQARHEREEAQRKTREAEEREAREEEERLKREDEERKRKARDLITARQSQAAAKPTKDEDDIGITDEDLDMDDVKSDERSLSAEARRTTREREARKEREAEPVTAARTAKPDKPVKIRRPAKWGKPVALTLFLALVAALGIVHVVPISTTDYEKAASDALGKPVRIASLRLSLYTGVRLKADGVSVGDAKIAAVRAHPEVGALFNPKKSFSRIELDGVTLPLEAIGPALLGKIRGENFGANRLVVSKLKLEGGPLVPLLDADIAFADDGSVRSARLTGPESLDLRVTVKDAEIEFDMSASQFKLPVAPEITLGQFAMKGTATSKGMNIASWNASALDGTLSGSANLRWANNWTLEGVVTARGVNAAVFAPALLSEGRVEGTGKFSMTGAEPAKLSAGARLEGNFTVSKGALGSFDLSRAIQTGGRQFSGRTQFSELTGQGVYDKGAVSLRNLSIGAGALNAGASADITPGGALSGRIVADVKTGPQSLRATLSLGGTAKEPQVRN